MGRYKIRYGRTIRNADGSIFGVGGNFVEIDEDDPHLSKFIGLCNKVQSPSSLDLSTKQRPAEKRAPEYETRDMTPKPKRKRGRPKGSKNKTQPEGEEG